MAKKLHPAWTALVVTFITLMATAGFRSAPSILIVPLEDAFGWSRSDISLAIAINVMLYGLIAPFAAALINVFGTTPEDAAQPEIASVASATKAESIRFKRSPAVCSTGY